MSNSESSEGTSFDLEVDFLEFIVLGKFGFLNSQSNCLLLLMTLGAPDSVSGLHRKLSDPLILYYGELQLQLTLLNDHLELVALTLDGDELDELPLSFFNIPPEEERTILNVEKLLHSQNVTWEKDVIASNEDFESFQTDRKVTLIFNARTKQLVYIGAFYETLF
jgi:hypothetical protein